MMSNVQLSKQNALGYLKSQILAWPGISKHPHSYGGTEFRFGRAKVGHLDDGGTLHLPLPKAVLKQFEGYRIQRETTNGYIST